MQCIIFSFNRACQLNTLLESMRTFLQAVDLKVSVVYNSSSAFFEEGYTLLKKQYPEVDFVKEALNEKRPFLTNTEYGYWRNYYNFFKYPVRGNGSSFKHNISTILQADTSGLVFFLTDDSLFLGKPLIDPPATEALLSNPSQTMFSFRHGLNLTDTPKQSIEQRNGIVHYKVMNTDSPHWTYKFSVDGHVYSKDFIKMLSDTIHYSNPNSFEAFLNTYSVKKDYFRNIYFNKANTLVGFELNRVQSFSDNNNLNFSTEKLNSYFVDGYTLRYSHGMVNDFRPVLNGLSFFRNGDSFEIKL